MYDPDQIFTARREYETIHPLMGLPHRGMWVVRDSQGRWVDADKYINDLKNRYKNLEYKK